MRAKPLPLSLAGFLLVALATISSAAPLWDIQAPEDISDVRVSPIGNVIVTMKTALMAVDPETGKTQWQLAFTAGRLGITFIPGTPVAVAEHDDIVTVLDVIAGKTIWDTSGLALKKLRGYQVVPNAGVFLVYGEVEGGSDKVMMALDMSTGEVRWRQDALLLEKPDRAARTRDGDYIRDGKLVAGTETSMLPMLPPLVHGDGLVLYVSKDGLIKINAETGQELWRVVELKGQSAPCPGIGDPSWVLEGDVLYVLYDERRLIAVDLKDGRVVWNRKDKFKSRAYQMEMSPEGLVVRGYKVGVAKPSDAGASIPSQDFYLDLIDPASGNSRWKKPFENLYRETHFLVNGSNVLIPQDTDVLLLNLKFQSARSFGSLGFEGGDVATSIERVGTGFLVTAAQNMTMLDETGQKRYHAYYPAPERGWLERQALRAAHAVGEELVMKALYGDLAPKLYVRDGSAEGGIRKADFLEKMDYYEEVDPEFQAILAKRFNASGETEAYRYLFTDKPGGAVEGLGLIKIKKQTGDVEAQLLMDDRDPDYVVDPVTETAYVRKGTRLYAVR